MLDPHDTLLAAIAHFGLSEAVTPEAVKRTTEHHGFDSELRGLFQCVHARLASALYNLDEEHRSFEGVLAWTSVEPDDKGWFFFLFADSEDHELYLQSRETFEPLLGAEQRLLLGFFERNLLNGARNR